MAAPLPSRGDIVKCLLAAGKPLHAREILVHCKVAEGSYSRLLELLDQLSFDGTIRRAGGSRFRVHRDDTKGSGWEGVLSVHPRGFGFVAAAGQDDVFIPPDGIGGALHGDRVKVMVVGRSSRGPEGRVEDIVARRNPRVAGLLKKRGKSCWLEPDDQRVRGPIVVTAGDKLGKDGEAAVVSITRFPESHDQNPEGELIAVLGVPGDPNAEVAKILVREQIVEEHPEAAVHEAEAMAQKLQRSNLEGRVDLRKVPLPTIDPEDARDHDDAVWVERVGEGYRVYVAIADVSEYVQPGSALDAEARNRGCTIYLPDRAIPMLPAALAADLCSLLPEADRFCLCVVAELDKNGDVKSFEVVEGVMRSCAMLTYGGVARALGFSDEPPRSAQADAMKQGLRAVDEVSRKLRKKRMKRGALDLDLPEAKLELDRKTGAPVNVTRRAQDPGVKRAYQMIEELMLLANELVAQWLSKQRCPAIYRVHAKPDQEKLERLGNVATTLGVRFDLDEMLEPKGVAKWLHEISEHPKRTVMEMLLLRSLKQAVYDIVNIGHFGLASDAYLHFTSPIRRYPDLVVHRIVKHLLRGGKPDTAAAAIEDLRASATAASTRERSAMEVEREVVDLYRCLLMRGKIGEVMEGSVTALVGSGIFVSLDAPFVDVLIRYEALGPDRYEPDEDGLTVTGARSGDTIALGDRLVVEIEDVAILRRQTFARRIPPDKAFRELQQKPGRRTPKRQSARGGPPKKDAPRAREGREGRRKTRNHK